MIITLIWLHFISNFLLQSDRMAINKSSSNKWLSIHCIVYSIPFILISFKFALINGLCHFITDYITSRITSNLWKNNKRHSFFVTI